MQRMIWTTYNDDGTTTSIPCTIVEGSEFYEAGDPVPGCSIRFEDGRVRGSIDMRDLEPEAA